MNKKQSQASKRLLKKLSALRATLSNDERHVLDSLVEVEAHKLNTKAGSPRATGSKASGGKAGAREVEAHKFDMKVTAGKAAGKASGSKAGAREVEAHQVKGKIAFRQAGRQADRTASKTTFRVAFDPNSEEYRIVD